MVQFSPLVVEKSMDHHFIFFAFQKYDQIAAEIKYTFAVISVTGDSSNFDWVTEQRLNRI